MNRRTRKILTATAVTLFTAIMLAVTTTACLRGFAPKTDAEATRTVIDDLNRYTYLSRLQRCRYERYADRASVDGCRSAAGLFNALARSERVHENACTRAVGLLKGECKPAEISDFEIFDTESNLRHSLDEERMRFTSSHGTAVTRAIESGNYYTARVLIWIDGTNRRHIELLERCLNDTRQEGHSGCEYDVCPVCGNIYEAENCDAYCPLCRTHSSEFESFGRLQIHQAVADGVND